MRDPIRERDLEKAGASSPIVDVDDAGLATVTLRRDELDLLLQSGAFDRGYANGHRDGLKVGRAEGRAQVRRESAA